MSKYKMEELASKGINCHHSIIPDDLISKKSGQDYEVDQHLNLNQMMAITVE